ncbi:hypothetical protein ACFL2X_04630 [Candidatus Latescibacterota bacterium]
MARVSLFHVVEGDIIEDDIIINEAFIFGSGTVLTKERIELLKDLNVKSVGIESHRPEFLSEPEIFENIDERFGYVKNSPVMSKIESWVIDKISNTGTNDETSNR